jgi:hypothetical protein
MTTTHKLQLTTYKYDTKFFSCKLSVVTCSSDSHHVELLVMQLEV